VAEEHAGFANTVNAKGEAVDAREVDAFQDESEAGLIRTASQTTPSSIAQPKTAEAAPVAAEPVEEPSEDDVEVVEEAEGQGANEA
jgi:hypothetical protein